VGKMKQYLIKARTKGFKNNSPIKSHIFAADEETAMMKFRAEYDKEENINYNQVEFISIEEVK